MSKKYFLRVLAGAISLYISILFVVNILIDPDMEHMVFKSRLNNKHFFHSAYSAHLLFDLLKTKKVILVFGTSRTHQINTMDFDGSVVLNLHAIYGTPYAALDFLKNLDDRQWANITEIYFELSDITYNGQEKYKKVDYQSRWSTLLQTVKETNFDKLSRAYWTVNKNINQNDSIYINNEGAFIIEKELPPFNAKISGHVESARKVQSRQVYKNDSYIALKDLYNLIKTHHITPIYFTTPLRKEYIECSNIEALQEARSLYVDILGGYYDLSYIEQLSNDSNNFSDSQHTNTQGKNYYLKILKERDSRFYITKAKLPDANEKLKIVSENGCQF